MPRRADTTCVGGCGKLAWREGATCNDCRRELAKRICEQCGKEFRAGGKPRPNAPQRFCSIDCRVKYRRTGRSRTSARARRAIVASTWDGVTDEQIWERDSWKCLIPGCKLGLVRRDRKYPHPLSPSVDHIAPLSRGGTDISQNKRSAHLVCNVRRNNRTAPGDVQIITPELAPLGLLPVRERPVRCPVHGSRKVVRLPWPRRLYHRPCRFCGTEVSSIKPASRQSTVCQACQADAKCSSCGTGMWIVVDSLPPRTRLCQGCRGGVRNRAYRTPVISAVPLPEPVKRAARVTLGEFWALTTPAPAGPSFYPASPGFARPAAPGAVRH